MSIASTGLSLLGLLLLVGVGCEPRSDGEKLWRRHCSECHGHTGAGNLPAYSRYPYINLVDAHWSDEVDPSQLEDVILSGVFPTMPPFDHLSEQELRDILEHIRVLRGETY